MLECLLKGSDFVHYQKKLDIVFNKDSLNELLYVETVFEEMPTDSLKFEIRDGFNNIVFSDKYSKKMIKSNSTNNEIRFVTNCLLLEQYSPYYIYLESKKEFKTDGNVNIGVKSNE